MSKSGFFARIKGVSKPFGPMMSLSQKYTDFCQPTNPDGSYPHKTTPRTAGINQRRLLHEQAGFCGFHGGLPPKTGLLLQEWLFALSLRIQEKIGVGCRLSTNSPSLRPQRKKQVTTKIYGTGLSINRKAHADG
jgi:hypothetical protein